MPLLKADRVSVTHEQISFFVGKNFVISFCTGSVDPFEPVRKRLRSQAGKIRSRNSDYLLYALIDVIIDQGFPLLEWFGESIEDLEEELLANPDHDTLLEMHQIRRNLVLLRRMLWPQREVINRLTHNESHLLQEESRIYYADCYDHTIQIMDLVETYREMTTSMLDVYLSSASNKMNEVMRLLTVIATIFIPLTFLVGVYGMNFNNPNSPWDMPELKWYYGYPLLWLLMIAIAGGMLLWFRHKKWL
jgi:magnesium transporter